MTIYGIDVSNHQREFNFAAAKAEGYDFATHKVTESNNYKDPYWPRARAEMAKHFPGRFGGYHFWRRSASADSQAALLESHIGDKSIPIQLDFEDTDARGVTRVELDAIINAIQSRGMRIFINYIPRWYWQGNMGSADLNTGHPLWASNYGTNGVDYGSTLYSRQGADNAPGWADYGNAKVAILQFGEHGRVAGQQIDVNAYRGTPAQLDALFGGKAAVGTPEEVLFQETGSQEVGKFPGFKARRWGFADEHQPNFTQTDFMREVDREVNSVFDLANAPTIDQATLVGQVLAARAEGKQNAAKLDAILSILQSSHKTI